MHVSRHVLLDCDDFFTGRNWLVWILPVKCCNIPIVSEPSLFVIFQYTPSRYLPTILPLSV